MSEYAYSVMFVLCMCVYVRMADIKMAYHHITANIIFGRFYLTPQFDSASILSTNETISFLRSLSLPFDQLLSVFFTLYYTVVVVDTTPQN